MLARSGDYDRALEEIEQALRVFENADDGWGVYHALSLKESALYWQGSPEKAAAVCGEALERAPQEAAAPHTLLSLASRCCTCAEWQEADVALDAARETRRHASAAELARAQGLRGYRLYFTGHFREAEETLAPGPWQDERSALERIPYLASPPLPRHDRNWGWATTARPMAFSNGRSSMLGERGLASAAEMVLDNMGLLEGSSRQTDEGLEALRDWPHAGLRLLSDPVHAAMALSHEATILRRAATSRCSLGEASRICC